MALTAYQRRVVRLLAGSRQVTGESYVAGGSALNEHLGAPRISSDVDLFHDTQEALQATFSADVLLLESAGFAVKVSRERPAFIEAVVTQGPEGVLLQWVRDSTFRFFPLVSHPELGVTLHPFDLATNKILALVGRLEPRDWVDVIECHRRLQPLGYLAWAACGKDPGFSPLAIIEYAARQHYSVEEVHALSFAGPSPDVADLSRQWRTMMEEARYLIDVLPGFECGKCVLDSQDALFRGSAGDAERALLEGRLKFHAGHIGGALPQVVN